MSALPPPCRCVKFCTCGTAEAIIRKVLEAAAAYSPEADAAIRDMQQAVCAIKKTDTRRSYSERLARRIGRKR